MLRTVIDATKAALSAEEDIKSVEDLLGRTFNPKSDKQCQFIQKKIAAFHTSYDNFIFSLAVPLALMTGSGAAYLFLPWYIGMSIPFASIKFLWSSLSNSLRLYKELTPHLKDLVAIANWSAKDREEQTVLADPIFRDIALAVQTFVKPEDIKYLDKLLASKNFPTAEPNRYKHAFFGYRSDQKKTEQKSPGGNPLQNVPVKEVATAVETALKFIPSHSAQ